jgi:hypothetical protein
MIEALGVVIMNPPIRLGLYRHMGWRGIDAWDTSVAGWAGQKPGDQVQDLQETDTKMRDWAAPLELMKPIFSTTKRRGIVRSVP